MLRAEGLQTVLQWGHAGAVAMEAADALPCASSKQRCCSQRVRWRCVEASPGLQWSVVGAAMEPRRCLPGSLCCNGAPPVLHRTPLVLQWSFAGAVGIVLQLLSRHRGCNGASPASSVLRCSFVSPPGVVMELRRRRRISPPSVAMELRRAVGPGVAMELCWGS